MHYLKCNHCGEMNPLKSEMMTFCSSCGQKLNNSFSIWSKENPLKTFDDFKKEVCVSQNYTSPTTYHTTSKPTNWKLIIGLFIGLIVLYLIGNSLAKVVVGNSGLKTSESVLNQDWDRTTYGTLGLSIVAPVQLNSTHLALPDNVMPYISIVETYSYESLKGFNVMVNSIEYTPSIGEVNLEGAANGSVNEIRMQNGISNFDYTQTYIALDSILGFKQNGTYQINGLEMEFINVGYGKGIHLWQVMLQYPKGDETGQKVCERILDSIEIDAPETKMEFEEEIEENKGVVI